MAKVTKFVDGSIAVALLRGIGCVLVYVYHTNGDVRSFDVETIGL